MYAYLSIEENVTIFFCVFHLILGVISLSIINFRGK